MLLEVTNLRRYFGGTKAIDGISFHVKEGQIMAFVGPNGAGKTTTLKILATLDEPTAGDAFIEGVSVVEVPEHARSSIGYVPDSLPIHRDINVHEYLDFFARAYGIRNPEREKLVEGLEEFTNLMGIRYKMLDQLSKGMKQRVSLARALVHDPKILLMDEPAAGLDPRARVELRELLRVLASSGKAILISSHILTELAEICNGALIIERGRLLKYGSLEEIVSEGTPGRVILIRVLANADELVKELLIMPTIQKAQLINNQVEATIEGTPEDSAALLKTIIGKGFAVIEFRERQTNLETVFMNITKGDVQ